MDLLELKSAISNYTLEPSVAKELICIKDKKLQTKLGMLIQERKFTCKQIREVKKNRIEFNTDSVDKDDDLEFDYVNNHGDIGQRDAQVQKNI